MQKSQETPPAPAAGAEEGGGHDLLAAAIGLAALALLIGSPWLVDRDGPDPFYKGPLIFPMLVLTLTFAASVPMFLRLARGPLRGPVRGLLHVDGGGFPRQGAGLFGLMCLFPLAIGAVGLDVASVIVLLAGLKLTGRGWVQSVIVAAVLSVVVHLAFVTALDIWFPKPWLFDTITGG